MPWGNKLGKRIPEHLRQQVLLAAGRRCTHHDNNGRCTNPATEVDHILPRHQGGTDHAANLQALCPTHHRAKTQTEAATARWRHRNQRPTEQHPGLT